MNTDDPKFPKWIYDQIKQMNLEKRQDAAEIFFRQTIEDNAMVITLKAHLHFEKEIDELLEKVFRPKYIKDSFKSFDSKLRILKELELLKEDTGALINKLRNIRNEYAHDLEFDVDEKHYQETIDVLSKPTKKVFEKFRDDMLKLEDEPEALVIRYRVLLSFILFLLVQDKFTFVDYFTKKAEKIEQQEMDYIIQYVKDMNGFPTTE